MWDSFLMYGFWAFHGVMIFLAAYCAEHGSRRPENDADECAVYLQ